MRSHCRFEGFRMNAIFVVFFFFVVAACAGDDGANGVNGMNALARTPALWGGNAQCAQGGV